MYLSTTELRRTLRALKRQNAKPVPEAGNKYVCIAHPDSIFDLQADSTLLNIFQYAGVRGDQNPLFDATFYDLPFGIRVFESTNAKIYASAGGGPAGSIGVADVYATLVFGQEWFMVVDFEAMPASTFVVPRGSSIVDPLAQVAAVGYKVAHGAAILNQNLGVRLEHVTSTRQ